MNNKIIIIIMGYMEKLNIKKAHILGWPMGTEIALSFSIRYPEKIDKLVLYAADCSYSESVQPKPEDLALITGDDPKNALRALIPDDWLAQHPDPMLHSCKFQEEVTG